MSDSEQLHALSALVSFSSVLSMLGSGVIVYCICRAGISSRADALLLVLSALDLAHSFCMCFGRAFVPGAPTSTISDWCYAQANGIQFFGVASVGWTAVMSLSLLLSLRPDRSPLSAPPSVSGTLLLLLPLLLLSAVFAAAIDGADGYGNATLWCWVKSTHAAWQLAFCAPSPARTGPVSRRLHTTEHPAPSTQHSARAPSHCRGSSERVSF